MVLLVWLMGSISTDLSQEPSAHLGTTGERTALPIILVVKSLAGLMLPIAILSPILTSAACCKQVEACSVSSSALSPYHTHKGRLRWIYGPTNLMSHRGGDDACGPHAPQWPLQLQQPPGFPASALPFLICHSLHSLCAVAFFNMDSLLFPSRRCTAI